jgi:hypothetical protein
MMQGATKFDVFRDVVALVSAVVMSFMPFLMLGLARRQTKQNEKVAAVVAKTATDAAEKVATTVTETATAVATTVTDAHREADKKVDVLTEIGKETHTLVNSQKTELEHTIKTQSKRIERLLAKEMARLLAESKKPPRRRAKAKRGTR